MDVERTGSTSRLRSEDAGPLMGLAAAAEEKQRQTALDACHVVTVTEPVVVTQALSRIFGGGTATGYVTLV